MVKVKFGDKAEIVCEVAKTPNEQWLGLRTKMMLNEGDGMLFEFGPPRFVEMTMLGMSFPVDMIFIDRNMRVRRVVDSVQAGVPAVSCDKACMVIETKAGYCKKTEIKEGDLVSFKAV